MKHLCSCPFDSLTLSPMNISSTSFQLFTSYDAGYVQTLSLAETVPLWVLYFKYFPLQPYFSIFFKLTCLIAFNNTILWLPWPFRYSNYICPSLSTSTSLLTPISQELYSVYCKYHHELTFPPFLFLTHLVIFQSWLSHPPEKLIILQKIMWFFKSWLVSL